MTLKTIQRGATLGKMVAAHNKAFGTKLTVDQVAKANGLKDPNKILAGAKLLFPDAFETRAPQRVFRNGDGEPMVRNGVKEAVTVTDTATPELLTTSDAKVSSNITPRPLEPFQVKAPELLSTTATKPSTQVQQRPLERPPVAPLGTTTKPAPNQSTVAFLQPVKAQTTQQKTFEPLPKVFADKGGSDHMMREVVMQGAKKGGYEQGLRWLQEMEGLKVDGRFGTETGNHLSREYGAVLQDLRKLRLAETKGRTAMAPLTPAGMTALKAEMKKAVDAELNKSGDPERAMAAAVTMLQRRLALGNEPLAIDGKMKLDKGTPEKTQTYESMVRLYGKSQADELKRYLVEDLGSLGVD